MAEKHEAAPSAMKPVKEFRENGQIGSASSWDKVTLKLFHIAFDRNDRSNLREFLDPGYCEPPTDDENYRKRDLYCFVTY